MDEPQGGAGVQAGFERVDPHTVVPDDGTLLYLEGWISAVAGVSRPEVVVDGRAYPVTLVPGSADETARRMGFWAAVPVKGTIAPGQLPLVLVARVAGAAAELGTTFVDVVPAVDRRLPYEGTATRPLVAICMATHNPPPDLFERQIETIRAQSHEHFVCLISDDGSEPAAWERIVRVTDGDSRFVVSRTAARLGFYRNFERCLSLVPEAASFVALSDQDDRWRPDKLATLVAALEESDATLVFSDMAVVSADGRPISTTYWVDRKNDFADLGSLLLSNTVTGAASLFRRELLDDVLPFPPDVGRPYHDHWIACVALALGEIGYVDRPLHDYVQHAENVLGHPSPSDDLKGGLVHALARLVAQPRRRMANTARHAGAIYRRDVVRLTLFAATLERRLGGRILASHASDVSRVARLDVSLRSFGWLLARSARDIRGESATLGAENQLLKALCWKYWHVARARATRLRAGALPRS